MGVSIIQAVPLPTPASSPPMLCGGKRHSFRTVYSVAGNTIPSWARGASAASGMAETAALTLDIAIPWSTG